MNVISLVHGATDLLTFEEWNALIVTFSTVVMAIFTGLLWKLAAGQDHASYTIERAYVTLNHLRPGLDFGYGFINSSTNKPKDHREATIRLEIKNHGNTPATITDMSLRYFVGTELPQEPAYIGGTQAVQAYLVKEHAVTVIRSFSILEQQWKERATGYAELWVYGYVDYIDDFGKRRRAGYARVYDRRQEAVRLDRVEGKLKAAHVYPEHDNLQFAAKRGYNYDRERRRGEGKDW